MVFLMSGQGIVVARHGARSEVPFCCFVVRLGEVGCVFHRHVEALALVTPLGQSHLVVASGLPCRGR